MLIANFFAQFAVQKDRQHIRFHISQHINTSRGKISKIAKIANTATVAFPSALGSAPVYLAAWSASLKKVLAS